MNTNTNDLPSVGTEGARAMANYTLTIVADSGYESTTEGRCSAVQYGAAVFVLHNEGVDLVALTKERDELASRVRELEAEVLDQCRLNGMGAERESALMGRVRALEGERAELRSAIDDAAYHYSQYIVEDTAHCTLTEHMLSAFDAALNASKEQP